MDDGVELKQLTVVVDSVGLGVGAGLASAIVLMAISAASVVIVLIILLLIYCLWLFGCDCWTAAVASREKFALRVGGLFLTSFSGNSGAKFSKEIVRVHPRQSVLTKTAGFQHCPLYLRLLRLGSICRSAIFRNFVLRFP